MKPEYKYAIGTMIKEALQTLLAIGLTVLVFRTLIMYFPNVTLGIVVLLAVLMGVGKFYEMVEHYKRVNKKVTVPQTPMMGLAAQIEKAMFTPANPADQPTVGYVGSFGYDVPVDNTQKEYDALMAKAKPRRKRVAKPAKKGKKK